MPSAKSTAKPKSYGNGPQGYFQRVLSDGARPFQYRPQTSRLLGQQYTASAQPINANRVASVSFHYPNTSNPWESLSPDTGVEYHDGNIQTSLEQQVLSYSDNELNQEHDLGINQHEHTAVKQTNAIPETQEPATVLSWLERMQERQPVIMEEVPASPAEEKQEKNDIQQKAIQTVSDHSQTANTEIPITTQQTTTPMVSPQRELVIQQTPSVAADKVGTAEEKHDTAAAQSTNVALPDGPVPKVGSLNYTEIEVQEKTEHRTLTEQTSTHVINQIHKTDPEADQATQKLPIKQPVVKQASHQTQKPASAPVTQSNRVVQGTRISKLQKALHTQPKSAPSSSRETSSTQTIQNRVAPKPHYPPPPVQQNITIINPSPGSKQSDAFWERNYMNRLGPRNFK